MQFDADIMFSFFAVWLCVIYLDPAYTMVSCLTIHLVSDSMVIGGQIVLNLLTTSPMKPLVRFCFILVTI